MPRTSIIVNRKYGTLFIQRFLKYVEQGDKASPRMGKG